MNLSRRRVRVLAVAPFAAALILAGCGSESETPAGDSSSSTSTTEESKKTPSAKELYEQARTTALAAKSGRVKGQMTDDGQSMTIDLYGLADGTNQSFTFGQGDKGTATITTVDGKNYISADEAFWTSQANAEAAKLFKGKFVIMPADEADDMGETNLKDLLGEMFQDEEMGALQGANGKVEKTTVDGTEAYALSDKVGGDGASLVVTADGKATLLKIVGPKDSPGEMVFSEWDAAKTVEAPKADDVIDMNAK